MKVLIRKQIHGSFSGASSMDVYLQREFDLPFTPTIGMYISDGVFEAQINQLVWDVEENQFTVYTESEDEIYNAELNRRPHRTVEEIADEWVEAGWEWPNRESDMRRFQGWREQGVME